MLIKQCYQSFILCCLELLKCMTECPMFSHSPHAGAEKATALIFTWWVSQRIMGREQSLVDCSSKTTSRFYATQMNREMGDIAVNVDCSWYSHVHTTQSRSHTWTRTANLPPAVRYETSWSRMQSSYRSVVSVRKLPHSENFRFSSITPCAHCNHPGIQRWAGAEGRLLQQCRGRRLKTAAQRWNK